MPCYGLGTLRSEAGGVVLDESIDVSITDNDFNKVVRSCFEALNHCVASAKKINNMTPTTSILSELFLYLNLSMAGRFEIILPGMPCVFK